MRPQASTKWWVLLAAVAASVATLWQHVDFLDARARERTRAPRSSRLETSVDDDSTVELELEFLVE